MGNRADLIVFEAILEDILNNKAASLPESNFMPHSPQCLIDVLHNLRRVSRPAELEKLLPNMTSVLKVKKKKERKRKRKRRNNLENVSFIRNQESGEGTHIDE